MAVTSSNLQIHEISLESMKMAQRVLDESPMIFRTPLLTDVQHLFLSNRNLLGQRAISVSKQDYEDNIHLHLKLENFQNQGSFKIRGIFNQFANLKETDGSEERKLVSMSAGNYGKAFAYLASKRGLHGKLIMPTTAPDNRKETCRKYGISVEEAPIEELQNCIDKCVSREGMVFLHSYDDQYLIAGHASIGLEILEDLNCPDVVLVGCGGGGVAAGIAAAIKLSPGCQETKIYAVEPEKSRTMHESFVQGRPVGMPVGSIASGLSPPYAGKLAFEMCRKYVDKVLLVSEKEIATAMLHLHECGLMVEPAGAAPFAVLHHKKLCGLEGKQVVVVISGGNITAEEICHIKNNLDLGLI